MHPFAQKKQGENQYTYYIENSNFACMTREDYLWQKENLGLDSHQLFNYKGTAAKCSKAKISVTNADRCVRI